MSAYALTLPGPLAEILGPDPARPVPARTSLAAAAQRQAAPNTVRIIGTLQRDAEWRVTAGARPLGMVIVHIDQPGICTVRATQVMGTQPIDHVAGSAKASRLRAGMVVEVHGSTLIPHGSLRCIELLGINHLCELRLPSTGARLGEDDQA